MKVKLSRGVIGLLQMKSGIELSHLKTSIRPQDDLYRHMNGAWIDSAVIPPDRSSDGAFYKLFQDSERQVREIIEELGAAASAPATAVFCARRPSSSCTNRAAVAASSAVHASGPMAGTGGGATHSTKASAVTVSLECRPGMLK